jgi:PAS domain S-box-containing protein
LLDYNLPDGDGIEVIHQLRDASEGHDCAIVMLTAYGGEELAVRAMKAGASDYLPKGRLAADIFPRAVFHAIQSFRMHQEIEKQRSALITSQRRYQELLEAIPQMVWTANADGRLEYVNRRWCDYTGMQAELACEMGWNDLLHPEDRESTWKAWKEAAEQGVVLVVENRIRRSSDGSYRWHLVRAVPMRDANGEIANWLGTCTEIEDQKRAGQALLQEQKTKGIGLLAGGVAHDFNNLLVCVLGGASCAMEVLPRAHPAQEMLEGVVQAGERLAELTRKMLAYAGKATFYLESTNVGQLVRDACESIRGSIPDAIRLEIRNGHELPPVKTDAAQMRQAIVDLVMNAAEAISQNSPGKITVRTELVDLDTDSSRARGLLPAAGPGQYVQLEVRDTGCGMDEDTRNKIFDPFFSTKFVGRGLGLAAVQGFVRSIGGGVHVESKPGHGTAFQILLPVCTAETLCERVGS